MNQQNDKNINFFGRQATGDGNYSRQQFPSGYDHPGNRLLSMQYQLNQQNVPFQGFDSSFNPNSQQRGYHDVSAAVLSPTNPRGGSSNFSNIWTSSSAPTSSFTDFSPSHSIGASRWSQESVPSYSMQQRDVSMYSRPFQENMHPMSPREFHLFGQRHMTSAEEYHKLREEQLATIRMQRQQDLIRQQEEQLRYRQDSFATHSHNSRQTQAVNGRSVYNDHLKFMPGNDILHNGSPVHDKNNTPTTNFPFFPFESRDSSHRETEKILHSPLSTTDQNPLLLEHSKSMYKPASISNADSLESWKPSLFSPQVDGCGMQKKELPTTCDLPRVNHSSDTPRVNHSSDTFNHITPRLDDIDLSLDRHIKAISDEWNKSSNTSTKTDLSDQHKEVLSPSYKEGGQCMNNDSVNMKSSPTPSTSVSYQSQENSVQVTQSNAVNININIHMPSSQSNVSCNKSDAESQLLSPQDSESLSLSTSKENKSIINTSITGTSTTQNHLNEHHTSTTKILESPTEKVKASNVSSFSSIESFLGMNSDSVAKPAEEIKPVEESNKPDRISVIKPLVDANSDTSKNSIEEHNKNNGVVKDTDEIIPKKLIHPSQRFKDRQKSTETVPSAMKSVDKPKPRPLHPSMRLKRTIQDSSDELSPTAKSPVRQPENNPVNTHLKSPLPSGKPRSYALPGGKPTNYMTAYPTSDNQQSEEESTTPTSGKPLSFLNSLKAADRGKNKNEKNANVNYRPAMASYRSDKVEKERHAELEASKEDSKSDQPKKLTTTIKKVSEGKPFHFKNITFDNQNVKGNEDQETSSSGSSSSSESESESEEEIDEMDTANEDDDERVTENQSSQEVKKAKRKREPSNSDVISALKKRKTVDEEMIKVPLRCGWRRQTRLRPAANSEGLRGDVYYYAPCGKKLRTYPELNSYMLRNEIDDVSLENFSFSTKLKVGDFLEAKQGAKAEKLTEEQINARFDAMKARDKHMQEMMREKKEKKKLQLEKSKQLVAERMKKKQEKEEEKKQKEQERRRLLQEKALENKRKKEEEREALKLAKKQKADALERSRLEKKAALEASKLAKKEKVQKLLEKKQQEKEEKEKERLAKLDELKMKREMQQQAVDNQQKVKKQKIEEAKVQERERKKQELVIMKAYEVQRKAEDKERQKEQKRLEKVLLRQRKIEQKRYERLISRELKKPIDDLALTDLKTLPSISTVPNLRISGQAYADLLMVEEFVHTFAHVLDIDIENEFPSMSELQSALVCESTYEDGLFNACQALLFFAVYDPGVSGKYASTKLGVPLRGVELNENNISEILRLFILSRNNGADHILTDQLLRRSLFSLSPSHKAAALAFLCNELLCGKAITNDIDNNLENMSNLRRNKWTLENDIRKLKTEMCKLQPKTNVSEVVKKTEGTGEDSSQERTSDGEDADDESSQVSDSQKEKKTKTTKEDSTAQEVEVIEKKIKQIEKKRCKVRDDLFESSHKVRGSHLGQDRYKRRYFVLSKAGGVYVEGWESGYFNENVHNHTDHQKSEMKEKIGSLINTLKSPTLLKSFEDDQTETSQNVKKEDSSPCEPAQSVEKKNGTIFKSNRKSPNKNKKWFSLRNKCSCSKLDEEAVKKSVSYPSRTPPAHDIHPPRVKTLANDHMFLESIYACYSNEEKKDSATSSSSVKDKEKQSSNATVDTSLLFGLPPELDINLLIQQDPAKAAEILEMQTVVPQEIPADMKYGWWKADNELILKLTKAAHPRGMRERALQKTVARNQDYVRMSCELDDPYFSLVVRDEEEAKIDDSSSQLPLEEEKTTEIRDEWFPQLAYASDKTALVEVEDLEEKVFSASLQVKGWRLSQKSSAALQLDISSIYDPIEDEHPLNIAIARLLTLEAGIERRYLKHPFRNESADNKDESLKNSNTSAITPALRKWREAVSASTSAAQLDMCVSMLNENIAWEKSIMKVFCILCRKSDNEELLLLCDACDRGCHTYCCKPKLEQIPEGDWFCQECVLMASGSDQCYKCKGESGRRIKCALCPRHYHLQCLEPPLLKAPRSWACPVCKKARLKSKPATTRKQPLLEAVVKQEKNGKWKANSNERSVVFKEMEPCRQMLNELENHESAWPFLMPVNAKQFPEYYKIIRNPMDFHSIKTKLRDNIYVNREEFVRDARRVFMNCKTFNEDNSEVGEAGKIMARFFKKRWSEMLEAADKKLVTDAGELSDKNQSSSDDESSEIMSESESSVVEESDEE